MESESKSFSKDDKLKKSMDFNYLKNEGIDFIQKLSGDIWTDYNAHDPGITILEQLCYALTDLAYRTDYGVEQLLSDPKTLKINGPKNSFYSPRKIYSRHPVTIIDFRKLLIDWFDEIQNVWIFPVRAYQMEECLSGIFEMVIMPSLEFQKKCNESNQNKEDFIQRLNLFLVKNRNISEDCSKIVLLKPKNLQLEINLQINENSDPERIMAEVLFQLEVFLYRPVVNSSLQELIKEKHSLEAIFSGPRLSNGFIKDEDLKDRNKVIHIDQIKRFLSKIAGVEQIIKVVLDSNPDLKELEVNNEAYFKLNFDSPRGIFETIQIYVNKSPIKLDEAKTWNKRFEFWSKGFRSYKMGKFLEENYTDKLKGEFRNQGKYTSIQHQFPMIYGLGKQGVPSHESNERKATVIQLRAYLLFFEQHLANHLAQLSNLDSLFDVKYPKNPISYFSQPLAGKENLSDFEKLKEVLPLDFDGEEAKKILGFETEEVFLDRQNRLFDHLLARFGENIDELPFLISLSLNLISSQSKFKEKLLKIKSAFLMTLEDINYFQNKGENYKKDQKFSDLSGLEQIILTKTGISPKDREKRPSLISDTFDLNKVQMISDTKFDQREIQSQNFQEQYRILSDDEKSEKLSQLEKGDNLSAIFGKVGLKWILRNGLDYQNYRISKAELGTKSFEVIFKKEDKKWVQLSDGLSQNEAVEYINKLISHFRKINLESEGLFVVDHILLRSILLQDEIGFFILDEFGRKIWQSTWVGTENERKDLLSDFYKCAEDRENFKIETNSLSLIRRNDKRVLANYIPENKNIQITESQVDDIWENTKGLARLMTGTEEERGRLALDEIERFRLKGTLEDKPITQRRVIMNSNIPETDNLLENFAEDFFDQKVSIVLPDWPARFQIENFKTYFQNLVSERLPVHIEANVHWIGIEDFSKFEKLYLKWFDIESHRNHKSEPNSKYSLKLALMINSWQKGEV